MGWRIDCALIEPIICPTDGVPDPLSLCGAMAPGPSAGFRVNFDVLLGGRPILYTGETDLGGPIIKLDCSIEMKIRL
jgi:hypothetical protein